MKPVTRRGFLQALGTGQARTSGAGTRTLVCVFLRGGADTLNIIVPYGDDRYYRLRPTLAIPAPSSNKNASIRLDEFYSFHPKLAPLHRIYAEGRLGIVQAVGSDNTTGSHFEAQDQMEHGEAQGRSIGGGWLGRHLRTRASETPLSAVAIGATVPESLRGAPGVSAIHSLDEVHIDSPTGDAGAVAGALSRLYGAESEALSRAGSETLGLIRRVEEIRGKEYRPEGGAQYSVEDFAQGLREVARLIKAEVGLEVASLDLGGWDTHFFQGTTDGQQADVISTLARGLAAFDADLVRYRDRVTVIVMTEFGRRVYENGSLGTDHGRGFALMAIGNRINGGRVIGEWPGLDEMGQKGVSGLLGPSGLKINHDYRSALSEVLTGIMGNRNPADVFPGFQPSPVGLVR